MLLGSCGNYNEEKKQLEDIYVQIDEEILRVPEYDSEKQSRINIYKKSLISETSPEIRRNLINSLIEEYESFISDSALFYVNVNLENPGVKNNIILKNQLLIKKADIAAHAGLFNEAEQILSSIEKNQLDSALLESYYGAYCDLFQYLTEYSIDSEYAYRHAELRELYIDSVSRVASPNSINYLVNHAASEGRNGNMEEAKEILLANLDKYESGDRNYSILASILADIYKGLGDNFSYNKYLGLTVISDLRGSIKENMALRALATESFKKGDLKRADKYIRQSFEDANFYAARMRNAQSSRMLPVIAEAYNAQQKKLQHTLVLFVIFISILAFGLIIISVFAGLQVVKIRRINKKTEGMLKEVSELSSQLTEVNERLSLTNQALETSNKIKGEYAALFMEYSSLAISALQSFQQSLKVAAAQGNLKTLIKKIESPAIESKTISDFYSKFDEAVLSIYPNFVEKVNNLLRPEERIELKPVEGLNTELRITSLIKIGIQDPEKIAKFLRCSISTVYTYRSRLRKKAIDPDTFEMQISYI